MCIHRSGLESAVHEHKSVRSHEITRAAVSASSVRNRLVARIVALRPEGPLVRVELDAGFRLFALVTRPACEEPVSYTHLTLPTNREV